MIRRERIREIKRKRKERKANPAPATHPLIIHLNIPGSGGHAIHDALVRSGHHPPLLHDEMGHDLKFVGPESETDMQYYARELKESERASFVCFTAKVPPYMPSELYTTFCVIRHPISRAMSLLRRNPDRKFTDNVVVWPNNCEFASNYLVRLLLNKKNPATAGDVDRAYQVLQCVDHVYIYEDPMWVGCFNREFGCAVDLKIGTTEHECSYELQQLFKFDLMLYERVLSDQMDPATNYSA